MAKTPVTHSLLETAYSRFHGSFQRERDPISVVHSYSNRKDQEVAALLVASLSYGNVRSILQSTRKVLSALSDSPHSFLLDGNPFKSSGFRHRFTVESDIQILCAWISSILRTHGSVEKFFLASESTPTFRERMSGFVRRLRSIPIAKTLAAHYASRKRNMDYLISDPLDGSACKRLNMFLRWMVRPSDGIDLGLWSSVSPANLYLPVDTHVMSILKQLRWTQSKSATWRVVEQATERLREYCPEDPIRYDFALCHLSMEGHQLKSLRN